MFHKLLLILMTALFLGIYACGLPSEGPRPLPAPPPSEEPRASDSPDGIDIRASRIFVGPDQYPPHNFAAYGIVAFRSKPTNASRGRYIAICNGFLASIPSARELSQLGIDISDQMATVWPVNSTDLADFLNEEKDSSKIDCTEIVSAIYLPTSLNAIRNAEMSDEVEELRGDGPFLLAWSPSATFGQAGALVLVWDFSNVTTEGQAERMFKDWAKEIEQNPELWSNGWNLEKLRRTVGLLADKYGAEIVKVIGSVL